MSDTQGSHRRGGPLPEAYGAEPQAWTAGTGDPGDTLRDPDPDPDPGVPGPRPGSRRAGRRRRTADTATGPGLHGAGTPAELAELAGLAALEELAELAERARFSEADT
ncbi:hypothetical protein ACFCYI_38560, partial [Streptomyces sp. NPDC056257]|uniref:hypothetical protein n=1 Tax=Streptomyces sp. NPDC056257 TaxID=3345765 RepID=UPI0035DD28EF